MYLQLLRQMNKTLGQLDTWLTAAAAYADTKKVDHAVFLGLRLAPDQFPFARQIQIACDTAKQAAARITGQDAPKHADDEKTFAELQARIASVRAYLDGFTEAQLAGAGTRTFTTPRWEGKTMTGADYMLEHALPNFYFHATTAYAILRHNGVPLGKKDFLGKLTMSAPGA